jgi:hypothetical protein
MWGVHGQGTLEVLVGCHDLHVILEGLHMCMYTWVVYIGRTQPILTIHEKLKIRKQRNPNQIEYNICLLKEA